jgi:AP-1 complex subunit gamma-1
MRLIKKVPDLIENFLVRAKQLIHEKSHAPLLTGITLVIEMCTLDPTVISELITVSVLNNVLDCSDVS